MILWRERRFARTNPEIIVDSEGAISFLSREMGVLGCLAFPRWHSLKLASIDMFYLGRAGWGFGIWESRSFPLQTILCLKDRDGKWFYIRRAEELRNIGELATHLVSVGVTRTEEPPSV